MDNLTNIKFLSSLFKSQPLPPSTISTFQAPKSISLFGEPAGSASASAAVVEKAKQSKKQKNQFHPLSSAPIKVGRFYEVKNWGSDVYLPENEPVSYKFCRIVKVVAKTRTIVTISLPSRTSLRKFMRPENNQYLPDLDDSFVMERSGADKALTREVPLEDIEAWRRLNGFWEACDMGDLMSNRGKLEMSSMCSGDGRVMENSFMLALTVTFDRKKKEYQTRRRLCQPLTLAALPAMALLIWMVLLHPPPPPPPLPLPHQAASQ